MFKLKVVSFFIVVLFFLAAVLLYLRPADRSAVQDSTIKIGYIGPLTGPSAVLGMDAVKALEIAVDNANKKGGINGKKVAFIAEDDQYLTKSTVSAYTKLVNIDNVKIIFVATYGGLFAIGDRAKKDGVIILDPLDCNSQVANADKNIFCLATETESIGYALADYAIANKKMHAAILYSTKDNFMSLVADTFKDRYLSSGGLIQQDSFNYDDIDFKTQLLKFKNFSPDVLVLLGHDETGIIMRQARDLGIASQFLTTGTITSPSAQKLSAGYAEGTIFAYWEANQENSRVKEFENIFVKKVGRKPILPLTTHPAYDALTVLFEQVLPNSLRNMSIDEIKNKLLTIKNYAGTTGVISFGENGAAPIKESVFKLINGVPAGL